MMGVVVGGALKGGGGGGETTKSFTTTSYTNKRSPISGCGDGSLCFGEVHCGYHIARNTSKEAA